MGRDHDAKDVFTKTFRDSVAESIQCKLESQEHEIQRVQAGGWSRDTQQDIMLPALRTIQDRWKKLKEFSIVNIYREVAPKYDKAGFTSDDEMLATLVHISDEKIDQIITTDKNTKTSQDLLVPALCYELLLENAELRKMCNTYQLKVLRHRDHAAAQHKEMQQKQLSLRDVP